MDPEAPGQALAVIADKAQFLVQAQDTAIHFHRKWKLCQKIRTSYLMIQTKNRKFNMTTSFKEITIDLAHSHQSTKQAKRSAGPLVYLATAAEALSQAKPHPRRVEAAKVSTEAWEIASTRTSLHKSARSHKCLRVDEMPLIRAQEVVETYSRSSISSSKLISRIIKSPTKHQWNQISPTWIANPTWNSLMHLKRNLTK